MGIRERREREKQGRKLHIIDAAEKVFFSKGYLDATMDQIAQEAELSRAALYLYFKNKEDVHKEIVSRGIGILYDLISSHIDDGSTGMARLAIIWDTTMAFSMEYADYFDALIHYETKEIDLKTENEMEDWLNRYKILGLVIRTVEEGISDGSIRQGIDPSITSLMFWIQVTGAVQLMRFKGVLIKHLLKIQPDEFRGNLRKLFFEHLSKHNQHLTEAS